MGSFKLQLTMDADLAQCSEVAKRATDFSIPFAKIISKWAYGNQLKFDAGKGKEMVGASGGDLNPATWEPLQSFDYIKQKRRQGYPDALMVRTGALRDSLTVDSPESEDFGFESFVGANQVAFGTPSDAEDADKAMFNYDRRPTIFLSEPDRNMIRGEFQSYLNFGENYAAFLWDRARALHVSAQMDAEYGDMNG